MGNTLVKDVNSDKRFGDSLLAKEIKKIMMEQQSVYHDKPINIHLAKACCKGAAKKDASLNPNAIISIGFPKVIDKTHMDYSTKCVGDGICLERYNVGFQIDGDYEELCGKNGKSGQLLSDIATGDGGNSQCDNFMGDYCAKSLYEQGCIGIGKNPKGKIVPKFFNNSENKMCWNNKKMSSGPPECACLNSIFGPNLNTNPGRNIVDKVFGDKNPYGIPSDELDDGNLWTKYSLNIFKTDANKQFPKSLDKRCTLATTASDSGTATAWTLSKDKGGNVSICLNQINIADSDIGKADFSDIKQSNNCGGPSQETSNEDLKTDPNKKADKQEQDNITQNIIDEENKKKEEADRIKKEQDDKKKQEEEAARIKKEQDDKKKQEEEAARIKKEQDDKKKQEDADKKDTDKKDTDKKDTDKKDDNKKTNINTYYIVGGGIGVLLILSLSLFLIFRKLGQDDDDDDE